MTDLIRFHGSDTELTQITSSGIFGGLFGASESSAMSHGKYLHRLTSVNPLSNYELNYEINGAYDTALNVCDGNEEVADIIMTKGCETHSTDPEDGWELQRLRGLLALALGYDSVEMEDEHGTTWLFLPGCKIDLVSQ